MRVTVNGWFWEYPATGSGQYIRRVTEALAAIEPSLELTVVLPSRAAKQSAQPPRHAAPNLHFIATATPPTVLGKLWWEQVTMPRLAQRVRADLLHTPYWASPALSPTPNVVTIHDIIPLVLPAYRGHAGVRLYTALVQTTAARARLAITDSEASRQDILHHLKLPPQRVRAISLAVDDIYAPATAPDDCMIRHQYGIREPYILYLGGFDVRKNLSAALEAFAIAHRACPELRLVVAGRLPQQDSAFTPDPRRLAADKRLPPQAVRFLGFIPEEHKPALYRGAQAFVYVSTYEGFGYPCLEALSCGTPVVGSDRTSLPEVVGPAGILLAPEDVDGIAGALIQLCCDAVYLQELRRAAEIQSRRFSWQRTATETLAAYHDALSDPA